MSLQSVTSSRLPSESSQKPSAVLHLIKQPDIYPGVQDIVAKPFARLSYTDAIELLLKAEVKFEFPVKWGSDLQSEHERYLTEQEFSGTPLFVTNYPKDIKVE